MACSGWTQGPPDPLHTGDPGRFMGGFGRDSCYRMRRKRNVRYMRILQRPYLQGFTVSR
jgi:hypothetical protein